MPRQTGELTGTWTLHRVVANDGGAGSFSDDTDYAGTNADPGVEIGVTGQNPTASSASARLSIFIVAVDANDAVLARASSSMNVSMVELCKTREDETDYAGGTEFYVDSAPVTGVTLNRRVDIDIEKGRYFVRLDTFSGIPATATELRIYVKAS